MFTTQLDPSGQVLTLTTPNGPLSVSRYVAA